MSSHVVDVPSVQVPLEPLPREQVVAGTPSSGAVEVQPTPLDGVEVGIWEHTVGSSIDVEADEVFVVISGRATVRVEGGATLELEPGTVGVLEAGARTTWEIHQTLRKVYITPR